MFEEKTHQKENLEVCAPSSISMNISFCINFLRVDYSCPAKTHNLPVKFSFLFLFFFSLSSFFCIFLVRTLFVLLLYYTVSISPATAYYYLFVFLSFLETGPAEHSKTKQKIIIITWLTGTRPKQ